jgi:hypothetical protein
MGMRIDMVWKLECLLCGATPKTLTRRHAQLGPLVEMQEHAMAEHGITKESLRGGAAETISDTHYQFVADGVKWLDAQKVKGDDDGTV